MSQGSGSLRSASLSPPWLERAVLCADGSLCIPLRDLDWAPATGAWDYPPKQTASESRPRAVAVRLRAAGADGRKDAAGACRNVDTVTLPSVKARRPPSVSELALAGENAGTSASAKVSSRRFFISESFLFENRLQAPSGSQGGLR
jgi:hypothetical protein